MSSSSFEWAVVGAGPAGIAAIGELLGQGIPAQKILWCDPYFKVGDLGRLWHAVHSNTKVRLFLQFLEACPAFHFEKRPHHFAIEDTPPEDTCQLSAIAEPLQWVTDELTQQVPTHRGHITALHLSQNAWHLKADNVTFIAKKVILAIGSEPKTLQHNTKTLTPISLENALDPKKLKQHCGPEDTVAVFGGSHSAMIILRSLLDIGVKRVVNFYLGTIRFAVEQGDWILFDNTGLKGSTAQWVRETLCGTPPETLSRIFASQENVDIELPQCNKVIDAIGFDPRSVTVAGIPQLTHNPNNGIIAPGLFGFGLAFPERVQDPMGNTEFNVGLWKFMKYIKRALPLWMKYHA